jgi:hypothetical protein
MRGMLAATGSTCIILGVFSQFVMGTFLKWRQMALINAFVPILSIILLTLVPESPHWLIKKQRFDEAKQAFQWLRGWTTFDRIKEEYQTIYDLLVKPEEVNDDKKSCLDSVRPYSKKTFLHPYLIILLCFFIGHFSGMTTLQTYAVQIFHTLKAPIDKYYATEILGILELAGTITCVCLVKKTGKRPLVFMSTIGIGICFLGTATYAYYLDRIPGGRPVNNIVANHSMIPQLNIIPLSTTMRNLELETTTDVIETTTDFPGTDFEEDENDLETTTPFGLETVAKEIQSNWEISKNDVNITVDEYLNRTHKDPIFVGEKNKYSWIPLTLLLGSAFFSHAGIRIIPWMLIGEVSYVIYG